MVQVAPNVHKEGNMAILREVGIFDADVITESASGPMQFRVHGIIDGNMSVSIDSTDNELFFRLSKFYARKLRDLLDEALSV